MADPELASPDSYSGVILGLFKGRFINYNHPVVIMPRAGEGRSIKIDPDVYEALLALKRGRMTISDVIAQMLSDCYGWRSDFPAGQRELEDFT